jgi:pyruvate kinase
VIEAMVAAGVDGVRINMSHGTYDEKAADISAARAAAEKMHRPLAVLVDLSAGLYRTTYRLSCKRTNSS